VLPSAKASLSFTNKFEPDYLLRLSSTKAMAAAQQIIAEISSGPSGSDRMMAPVSMATIGTITVDSPDTLVGSVLAIENQVTLPSDIGMMVM